MQQPGAVAAVVALVALADRESVAGQYAIQEGAAVAGAVDGGDRLGLRGCRTGPPERRRLLVPVCARPPTSRSLRHSVELVRMTDDSGPGLGGLMLEWGSPGEEGVVPLGSAAGSCKEVGSGRFPT
ncbi:hypothetical protein GW17_00009551 [Ensete ventricosum]|nr:hypothetical protein GW17_00009551 [Ensete ventricosum]